tara:strand:- start:806 stop:1195 length:390 start_codon:yes stop_codon:yes gene_type:complete
MLSVNPNEKAIMTEEINPAWTDLARLAPKNGATGRDYHPQTLARVARGQVANVQLRAWLEMIGVHCAKTQKRNGRWKHIYEREGRSFKVSKVRNGEESELSKIAKAIRGEVDSNSTNTNSSKRRKRSEV